MPVRMCALVPVCQCVRLWRWQGSAGACCSGCAIHPATPSLGIALCPSPPASPARTPPVLRLQADFSLFFDTDGRRSAYLAPERLVEPSSAAVRTQDRGGSVDPASDIFSLGCTLAELFLDGQPLFDFSRVGGWSGHLGWVYRGH